jgi:hypothetical protein
MAVAARRGQPPLPREEHEGSYLDAMLGSASVQLGVDPSVARYLPNHTLSRVPPPTEHHHLVAVDHHEHLPHSHPHYPHIASADASEASTSPATRMDGNIAVDGHHYHAQHQQADQSQSNGVPVPYEHDYASSSHVVFHHHPGEYDPTVAAAGHSHSQIDPSLRPQVRPQEEGRHDSVISEVSGDFEMVQGVQRQQQQTVVRPKKRRRVKDATSAGTGATAESPASKIAKRLKKDLGASPEEEDELQQHPPSVRRDDVQNGDEVDAEHVQGRPDVSTSHAPSAMQSTDGYLVNT